MVALALPLEVDPATVAAVVYTAGEIAAGIVCDAKSIRRKLRDIPADGTKSVGGNNAAAWRLESLPENLRNRLTTTAKARGLPGPAELLWNRRTIWEPSLPLGRMSETVITKAKKLHHVLAPGLSDWKPGQPNRRIIDEALARYRDMFKRSVSRKHLVNLIERTVLRDGGQGNWERLELYVRDHSAPASTQTTVSANEWGPAHVITNGFAKPKAPTPAEEKSFWDAAFAIGEDKIRHGDSRAAVLRRLRQFVERNTAFNASEGQSLAKKIRRKFALWRKLGRNAAALDDRRIRRAGQKPRVQLPITYLERLLARAYSYGGNFYLARAYRDSIKEKWVPKLVCRAYPFDERRKKSLVPAGIRAWVRPRVRQLSGLRVSAHARRDYTAVPSGMYFQSDDMTPNNFFWLEDEKGAPMKDEKGRVILTRGQFLPWIDARTMFIVTGLLLPSRGYDAVDILRGLIRLHDVYGLAEHLYLENGTWCSRLIDGTRGPNLVPWVEMVYGLSAQGIRVRHALPGNPRSKVIETVNRLIQVPMNRLAGYAGREGLKMPPETRRQYNLVRAGHAHPADFFNSMRQMAGEFTRICEEFNEERQNGAMIGGMSPREAFEAFRQSPPIKLPDHLRYLVARSRIKVRVGRSGIEILGGKFRYLGEAASEFVGQEVIVWFDPEHPETICVTDLRHERPFSLRLDPSLPPFDATKAQLTASYRRRASMSKYGRSLYVDLQHKLPQEFMQQRRELVLVNPAAAILGEQMTRGAKALKSAADDAEKQRKRARRAARILGVPVDDLTVDQIAGADKLVPFLKQDLTL
jgi:hypothetical protein